MEDKENTTVFIRVGSAIFYCVSSFLLILVNKTILTSYKFSSFEVLGIGQIATSIVVLYIAKLLKIVEFPPVSVSVFKKIWPLPLVYVGNLLFGLGGTLKISLPMFTALRRFSILFTMIAEQIVLGVVASSTIKFCVATMVGEAIVAASNDLSFDAIGYTFILMNNVCTATNNVYIKQKLDTKPIVVSKCTEAIADWQKVQARDELSTVHIGKYGLLFYNSLFMLVPWVIVAYFTGRIHSAIEFKEWANPVFIALFATSCVMGFVLNYSIVLCTFYNSALTTTIMGVVKNLAVTYIGMVVGGDYVFSVVNFIGLNISVLGSIVYTYATFKPAKPVTTTPEARV